MIEEETFLQAAKETISTLPDHQPTQEEIDKEVRVTLLQRYRDNKVNPDPQYSKILAAVFEDSERSFDDEEKEFPEVAELFREGLRFLGDHIKRQIVEREKEILESGFRFRALYEHGEILDGDLVSLMDTAKVLGDLVVINQESFESLGDALLPHHYSMFKRGVIPTYLTFNRNTTRVDEIAGFAIMHETFCPPSSPETELKDRLIRSEGLSKIQSSKVGVLYCLQTARRAYSNRQNYDDVDDFFDV